MLGFFMYGHIISFQIFVGGADIRMTCLITGYHDAFGICQITDAGVL